MSKLSIILSFLLLSVSVHAQDIIIPDRPDQTNSPAVVTKNYIQVETGLLFEKHSESIKSTSHPALLLRYGLLKNFEVNILGEWSSINQNNSTATGFAPLVFGFKAKIAEEKDIRPAISIMANFSANKSGKIEFQTPNVSAVALLLFQHTLSDDWSLGYNLGTEWDGENPYPTTLYTISSAYSFSEKIGGFAEIYGYFNKIQSADHRFDAGITYLLNNDLQIDASAGLGISDISPKFFVSSGLAYRFKIKKN